MSAALSGSLKRRRGERPTVFKLCLNVSPDYVCAMAFYNGGHCFGGRKRGHLVSFISGSLMFDIVGAKALPLVGGRLVFGAHFTAFFPTYVLCCFVLNAETMHSHLKEFHFLLT